MRILHVSSSLDPRGGGVAEAIRQMAAALVRAGHDTEVATVDSPGAEWLRGLPFPVHALGPSHTSYQFAPALGPWLRTRRGDFDCLITHGLWQHHGFAAWRAWRGPRFVFAHGMLDPWFKRAHPLKHLKKWLYWPWAEYRLLRDARAVFFTCEEERRLARESFWLYQANEVISPLGIEDPSGDAGPQREVFLERFPQLRGKRIILFLGRIHPKKGCDLLVEAWKKVAGSEADACLVMAGPGEGAFLEGLRGASDSHQANIVWTGMLKGDAKWGALRVAEAFILPSHQENFGIAVVEALACGIPVLISNKVNIWREIDADGAGLISEDTLAGTEDILARWFSLTQERREEMARRARCTFRTRYEVEGATSRLVEQLQGRSLETSLVHGP